MLRIYDFKCTKCGEIRERLVNPEESIKSLCCGASCERLPPICRINMGASGAHGYYDDQLGCYINSNKQRREVMQQQGVSEKGSTPKPEGNAWV